MDDIFAKICKDLYEAQDYHLSMAAEAADRGDMVQWQKMQDIAAGIRIAINIVMENDPGLRED